MPPVIGTEPGESAKNGTCKIDGVCWYGAEQFYNLLGVFDEHFTLPGSKPTVVDIKFTANEHYGLRGRIIFSAF